MRRIFAGAAALMLAAAAGAAETIEYSYDARGRLAKVERSGTPHPQGPVVTDYAHDKADNRTSKTVAGPP